jgi:integrase
MLKLKSARRDAFTLEEYRKLHSVGRKWVKEATTPQGSWYRQMCYNFLLIMCNTGMRPPEAKNLHWRDIGKAKDKDGTDILVIFVQGKGKTRQLIAPKSVGEYLDRVRAHSKATKPDDPVFTIINGKPAVWLYRDTVEELLKYANLRDGPSGIPRTTYCVRHTCATFRLSEGVDVYILSEQIGTSVMMIENHYGHVNTIKHADMDAEGDVEEATAPKNSGKARQAAKSKQSVRPARFKR